MFKLKQVLDNNGIYIIAEMSANHGGSLENALRLVRESAKAGADCLKIQTYTADSITIDSDAEDFIIHGGLWDNRKLYDLYKSAFTPYEWQEAIKDECKACGIDFLSTPFDPTAVDFLESIGCEAYKIASFELVDIPLIEYTASKQKPMIMSCGMATEEEIQEAIDACKRQGNDQISLLKCCSEYPANWDNMHLANIPDMQKRYGLQVGLSDHSAGSLAAVVAVGLGATIIEKHIKLNDVGSEDSDFSMPTEEFAKMIEEVRNAKRVIGDLHYGPTPGEASNVPLRRSLFAVADIKEGDLLTAENVRSIRPASGIKPKYYSSLLGKRAGFSVKKGTPITEEFFKNIK